MPGYSSTPAPQAGGYQANSSHYQRTSKRESHMLEALVSEGKNKGKALRPWSPLVLHQTEVLHGQIALPKSDALSIVLSLRDIVPETP